MLPYENHSSEIHLPALNQLMLDDVPNMVSMCPENYLVKAPSLKDFTLFNECPQLLVSSSMELSIEEHKGQNQLSRKKIMGMQLSNLEHLNLQQLSMDIVTIYDLQRLQVKSATVNSSLKTLVIHDAYIRNICVGPENVHLTFQNLVEAAFHGCNELRYIFSASISRSLPYLRKLKVSCCERLECIVEEDENDDDNLHRQECCFPNLRHISVEMCRNLKCLSSISTLPQLSLLTIAAAPELEQVFGDKKDSIQELDIKNIFPKLIKISLRVLGKLHTIFPGIDFYTIIFRDVEFCPNINLSSTDNEFIERCMQWLEESESNESSNSNIVDEDDIFEKLLTRAIKVAEKTRKKYPPIAEQNNGSTKNDENKKVSKEEDYTIHGELC